MDREVTSGATNWLNVSNPFHTAFQGGIQVEEVTWKTVALIPEGNGDFLGIFLVEII